MNRNTRNPLFNLLVLLGLILGGSIAIAHRATAQGPGPQGGISAQVAAPLAPAADDPNPPTSPVKLIFIHHSTGGNWLADESPDQPSGGLGRALMENNYFVSATNYGWEPYGIGSRTDIPNWPEWFTGPNHDEIMTAVYTETGQNVGSFGDWTRMSDPDPSAESQIIMFKSCFPNSDLYGNPDDPPLDEPNDQYTVANAKAVYNDILTYFATRQDKLFIVITAPPLMDSATAPDRAANARAFNNWLLNDWLDGYAHDNVAVFDYYNVLTSNGGDANTNDYDSRPTGNHHYWNGSEITHTQTVDNNYSAYPSGDSHPTSAGHRKATTEFVQLLNIFYHRWKSGGGATCTPLTGVAIGGPTTGYTNTACAFQTLPTPPDASTPITYTWAPAPDSGQGTDSVTYTWITTGARTITVSAVNCGGTPFSATHEIDIQTRGNYRLYLPLVLRDWSPSPRPTITPPPIPTPTPNPGALVMPADLAYQGAFVYPSGDEWAYSGHALAYYPSGDSGSSDGYPGSLYATGFDQDDLVAEIAIPEPVISSDFGDLPQAAIIQPLADITGGWKDNCTYNDDCEYREVDGLAYLPNVDKIAWNLNDWYNVGGYDQDSLGWSDLDMSGARGVWHIGARPSSDGLFHNNRTSDYLFPAPQSFADANLDGKWLIAGKHREAGAFGGSQGPTLYALAPWEDGSPPASEQNLDALALLYYPEIYACVSDPNTCHFPGYRAADSWDGGAWVQTAGASVVLIFGRKGLGDNCYGTQAECGGDPCVPSKGYHAYPYEPQILFYDPEEIKAVLAGTKEPWEVLPYEVYSPADEMIGGECATLGAAAYDRERGLLYVAEREAGPDGETVVHVWRVGK